MAESIRQAGIPAAVSNTAGTFVCNDVLYTLLRRYEGTPVRVAFVHVPFLPEQAGEGKPSLTLDQITAALKAAVEVL